jgi:hypothetical protein
MGFHSVIDSPDSVRRVIPPTTTIAKTKAATPISQLINAAGRAAGISDAGCALGVVCMRTDMPLNAAGRKQMRLQKLLTKLQLSDVML